MVKFGQFFVMLCYTSDQQKTKENVFD